MLKLARFLKPYWKESVFGAFLKLLEAFLELLLPFYIRRIIDIGIANADKGYVYMTVGKMLLFAVIGLVSVMGCQYLAAYVSCSVAKDVRRELMKKFSDFSFNEIDKFGTSTLINRITGDVNQFRDAIALLIRLVTRAPFLCIGAIIMAIIEAPQLSPIYIVMVPAFALILLFILKKTIPMVKLIQRKLDRFALVLRENLSGVRVIRALARQDSEKERINIATEEVHDSYIKFTNITSFINPLTVIVMNAGIIAVLYFGGVMDTNNSITSGQMVSLTGYVTQITNALIIISNLVNIFTKSSASASRINDILESKSPIKYIEKSNIDKEENKEISVSFKNVSFSYLNDELALENIEFDIPKGKIFGIIGTTGSGKTTIANLICRFYDVTNGEVVVNNINVKDYPKGELIKKIGFVSQKAVLFTGTIADNIRYGKEDAEDREIVYALKSAQAYDFVSEMRDGIHSMVKEGGKNFSGGQKQRLSIARGLVKKPDILILDDSLSALDYRTDLKLRQTLKENYKDTTIIIISQRISSVISADQILVLDNGKTVGLGRHDELLETCSTYKEIYETQTDLYGGADTNEK